jgi:hypothetical protein
MKWAEYDRLELQCLTEWIKMANSQTDSRILGMCSVVSVNK